MYEKTVSDISKSLRAMAKRVRRAEAQLSRRRGIPFGTTVEREANEQSQLWWDTDLDALMANLGDGWEPVKDVRTGTTAQRTSYAGSNAGEFWWDTDEERLYAWDGHSWESTDIAESGTTAERNASSPENGQWWLDTDDGFTYVYDGIEWKAPTSSRYIEPFLLLSETYGLFPFVPFFLSGGSALVNIMDYAYLTSVNPGNYNHYRMIPYNSPAHGDNGHIPYLNFVASSSQYCDTKNYGATGGLALLAWVSPDTASNIMPIIDKWYEVSGHRCYKLTLHSDNTFRFYMSDDGVTGSDYVGTSVLQSNEVTGWNFIAVRFDAGNILKIFHNGTWTSFGGSVPASIHDYDNDILFGKSNAASPVYFDGQMSIVAICKSAVNDEIVEYIYESTKHSYIPQPEPQTSDTISVGEYAYISLEDISWMIRPRESEHISVSESISMFGLTNPNVSENIAVTENIGVYRPGLDTLEVNVSDNVSISESVETVCSIGADISDNISVSENVATSAPEILGITVDDSVGVSESVDADGTPNITASESVSVNESTDAYYPQLGTLAMSVSDGITVTESAPVEDVPNIAASDSISISENADVSRLEVESLASSVSDSISVSEYDNVSITGALPSAINKVNYLLTDNEYFYANYWSRTYPYWTTAWIEPSYLLTNNGYFSANYWPRRYKYWAIAP